MARYGLVLTIAALVACAMGTLADPGVLLSLDFAAEEGGALRAVDGYAVHVSGFFGEALVGQTLSVQVSAASPDGATLGARLMLYDRAREKLDTVGSLWERPLTADLQTFTDEIRVDDPRAHCARLVIYRSNRTGTLLVQSAAVTVVELTPTAQLVAELEARLTADGYTLSREGDYLVGAKSDERCYWRSFPGQSMTPEAFRGASYAGTTWLRSEFAPPLFPIGVYIYGRLDAQTQYAEGLGMSLEQLFNHYAADVAAHHANTIYYANLTTEPEVFRSAVAAAQRHGVSVFGQLTGDLYLRPERGREHYEQVTLPTARRIMPGYRDLPGVLAWMGKEEAKVAEMPLVAEYRAVIRELDPTHALFTVHNHLAPFQADLENLPEWFGFDRYRFRCLKAHYGLLVSTPKDMAARLRDELRQFYPEAQKRGRPLLYVMQGYGHQNRFTTEEIRQWSGGAKDRLDPWSGFTEVEPGVWQGWDRYPPPEGGMHLQSWLAVSEGARGLLIYHYQRLTNPEFRRYIALVDDQGNETRLWREFAECMAEMKPFLPLILSWHKEALPRAESDHPEVKVTSFIRRFDAERFLVVVNERIATWDADSPALPQRETELHFDDEGLAGLHPAGPLTFTLAVEGEAPLWDLRSGERLRPGGDGRYPLTLGPGRGSVLVQGDADTLQNLRAQLGFTD